MGRSLNQDVQLPNGWVPMSHQREFFDYMFEGGQFPYEKRAYNTWHRRAGKDSCSINGLAVASQLRTGTFWHLLPTLNQGRKVVWNGVDSSGRRIIHQAFPKSLVEVSNENEMTLRLKGGSFYQVVGSDNYNSLVGSNPIGVIFSEWALSDPAAWDFVRPILLENKGFAVFITTPRGKNHAYKQWKAALRNPKWFTSLKTVDDTFRGNGSPIITAEQVQSERDEGVPEEIIEQEYYCSWEGINYGSIYGRQLNKYSDQQFDFPIPFHEDLPVFTAWDLGHSDMTAIIFYQLVNGEVHIIDFDSGSGMDADDWLDKLETEYTYAFGTPSLPHDAKNKTFATKLSARERFIARGLVPYIVPNMSVAMGIQAGRALLPQVWFNTANPRVNKLLEHLEAYQYEWDEDTKTFSSQPLHNEHSHPADAFRMLALSKNVTEQCNRGRATVARGPTHFNTPLGRALNLENLFSDRANRTNRRV
jgi:phage terminase large subunit